MQPNHQDDLWQPDADPDADAARAEANSGDDGQLIRDTLRTICRDPAAPAAARAQAARTLAELTGLMGRHSTRPPDPGKPLADMTRAELAEELARAAKRGTAPR
jgi:hypothetical protein